MFFQFPLWDTVNLFMIIIQCLNNFQFPLWDTNVLISIVLIIIICFQFPLWDTNNIKKKRKKKENNFQFPLWDTECRNKCSSKRSCFLSIPFMGYNRRTVRLHECYFVTFNSLYGIPKVMNYVRIIKKYFQFPLWDTRRSMSQFIVVKFFQFPLWDTMMIAQVVGMILLLSIPFMGYLHSFDKPANIIFDFQFPLWDTLI